MAKQVHVAVGVIINAQDEVLIALRHPDQHQGGLWEFPGGKVEAGESVEHALQRELLEEVNIQIESCSSLIKIPHDYGDKEVLLDVWVVDKFSGTALGKEGQQICWQAIRNLQLKEYPAANLAIIQAVKAHAGYAC